MPIVGLTDRQASFPRIGELRKGAPKPERGPGRDLNHFRFTSTSDDVVKAFYAAYPGEPQAVNIFLPFATTFENFDTWKEDWGAGSLKHRCDGENVVLMQEKGHYFTPNPAEPLPCPGGCKQVGRLKVIIPELGRLAYVVALTTSIHDITEIHANLTAYEALRGSLVGIPFILSRVPRMISTPETDKQGNRTGKRLRREKWLLHIEAAPEWVAAQLTTMKRAALPGAAEVPALAAGDEPDYADYEEIDTETGEIVETTVQDAPPVKVVNGNGRKAEPKAQNGDTPHKNAADFARWFAARHPFYNEPKEVIGVLNKKFPNIGVNFNNYKQQELIDELERHAKAVADATA